MFVPFRAQVGPLGPPRQRPTACQEAVLVSFGTVIHSIRRSFPRKRESTRQSFGNALSTEWIPAFAGMTGSRK